MVDYTTTCWCNLRNTWIENSNHDLQCKRDSQIRTTCIDDIRVRAHNDCFRQQFKLQDCGAKQGIADLELEDLMEDETLYKSF